MVVTVPPIRKSMGWKPAERIPTTFPRMSLRHSITSPLYPIQRDEEEVSTDAAVPNRPRQAVAGYEDP